jgi:small subunit ribosomal protein S6
MFYTPCSDPAAVRVREGSQNPPPECGGNVRKERKMRHYETIFIVHPNLNDEECKEVIRKFGGLLERYKGVLVKVEEWGNQRLAYRVKKSDRGHFILMSYCAEPGLIPELERDMKLDDRILKYQSVKISDHADPNELIRKQQESQKPVTAEAPAPPPDAEQKATDEASAEVPAGETKGEVRSDV